MKNWNNTYKINYKGEEVEGHHSIRINPIPA